jgi:hypothetical protein
MTMKARLLGACGVLLLLAGLAKPALALGVSPIPEIDAGTAVSALTLLTGGMMVLASRFRRA